MYVSQQGLSGRIGFRDLRLERRAEQLVGAIHRTCTGTLSRLASNRAEQVAFSGFLHHDHVHLDQLIYAATRAGRERVQHAGHAHVLVCSDTTEVNLKATMGYRPAAELGVTGNNSDPGFFIHAGFALDPEHGRPLGCVSAQLWTRGGHVDFGACESQKWFHVTRDVQGLTPTVTLVHDREGDIYDLWFQVMQCQTHLITRARQDRALIPDYPGGPTRLWAALEAAAPSALFELSIPADPKRGRAARRSMMALRFRTVRLRSPRAGRAGKRGSVQLQAVEVRECTACVPCGESPVVWRLLTTHTVETVQQALQIVKWYMFRWRAEDTFSALKTRGLDVEASRLKSGLAVMKLGVMSLWSAAKLTELVKRRDDEVTQASIFFGEDELLCLHELLPRCEGNTKTQSNPYAAQSVAWAVWIVARLGHWHGSGKPGLQIIRRGLERFDAIFLGWEIGKQS
ncbi:IS4 family transposase [Deinococcus marmoris]